MPASPSASPSASAEDLHALVSDLQSANADLRAANAELRRVVEGQAVRIAELERQLGADSSTSSKPPSSDGPYRKPPRRSSRKASGRKPGKQPGQPGSTMPLVEDPDEIIRCDPVCCSGCGADLSAAPETGVIRRQVTDVKPPPPPRVTEYQNPHADLPGLRGRRDRRFTGVRAGPCAVRARGVGAGGGVAVRPLSAGGPRRRADALPGGRGGLRRVHGHGAAPGRRVAGAHVSAPGPGAAAPGRLLPADETPGRAGGGLEYVHVAATEFLTVMHTGGRAKTDIDAGGVLDGYAGTIVRDGYAGYTHLIDAHHAWCGAHLLRDLRAFHTADPDGQVWAAAMADTLTAAHHAATAARAAGNDALAPETLRRIRNHYRGAVAKGITDNTPRAGPLTRDALTLARRFRDHEDMILRFVVDLAVPFTNNQAERDLRPVKIQQRTSGGCWRTLAGIADFAVVQSYLSTGTKWGLDTLDVLNQLFTTGARLPPAPEPC